MAHHHHGHSALENRINPKPLIIALIITATYMVAEIIGGIASNSLALLADAGHMATDVAALSLALFAIWFAKRPASDKRTFGFYRVEVLAALLNAAALIVISVYIFWESYQRLVTPPEVQTDIMLAVATGGLIVNLIAVWVLTRGGDHHHNLNTRGAYLHVLGDLLGSVAAIAAAVIMMYTNWYLADPILSAGIGALVLWSSWRLLRESVSVLMESTPKGMDMKRIRQCMSEVEGVESVHDLHVWTVTSSLHALSGHVDITEKRPWKDILIDLNSVLKNEFGITHITLQPEASTGMCDVEDGCCFESHAAA